MLGLHGDTMYGLRVAVQQGLGQALGFGSEDQGVAGLKAGVQVAPGRCRAEQKEAGWFFRFQKGLNVRMHLGRDGVPIVQAGSFQLGVGDGETQGFHQMQFGAGGGAQAGDVAGVGWNLRMHQNHAQRGLRPEKGKIKAAGMGVFHEERSLKNEALIVKAVTGVSSAGRWVGTGLSADLRYIAAMSWSSVSEMRPSMGPITRLIMVASVGLYVGQTLLQLAGVDFLTSLFGLSVGGIQQYRWWSLFTYMFLHGSPVHLLVNMLMLYFLGSELERELGRRHFILLFVLSGLLGGLGWLLLTWPYEGVCVGASGALFGLLGGYATLFPMREVTLLLFFVFPITMRAWVLAVVLGTVQFFLMVSPGSGGVAYSAHIAGGLAGALYVLALFRRDLARTSWVRGRARVMDIAAHRQAEADRQQRAEVDRLLDKVARLGLHTLSEAERRTLEQASTRLRSR